MKLNKAVFISLDNVLVTTKSGKDYPENVDDWSFVGGVPQTLKRYSKEGYLICIVSNQAGIGTGKVTQKEVDERQKKIDAELEQYIGTAVTSAYCPHLESYYRKPNPGMAYYFAIELNLSLRDSIMIGGTNIDNQFAKNAYIGTYINVDDLIDANKLVTDDRF
jgi:D-glycero-D-manno-heptose 1,7-bisphosphate phosphatase